MKSKNKFLTLKVAKNLNVDSLPLSKGDKIKALFVVSQTNFHGEFDVYVNKFKKLMGMNTIQLDKIFDTLVEAGIIKLVQAGKFKELCRSYSMVTPFNVDTDECDVVSFQFEAPGVPMFINRFIADGFTYKDFSTYKPREKAKNAKGEPDKALIAAQARIKALEDLLTLNDISIPPAEEKGLSKVKPAVAEPIAPVLSIVPDVEPETPKDGEEIRLTDQLAIIHFDDQLVINLGDDQCYIENHNLMAGWVANLDVAEQVRVYSTIINEQGVGITIPIKGNVKANFLKMRNGGFTKVVYKSYVAA